MTPHVFNITFEPLEPGEVFSDQPSARRGVRPKVYRVFVDGEQITECTSRPLFTACRWLTRRGHKGRALVWRDRERPPLLCIPDIERLFPSPSSPLAGGLHHQPVPFADMTTRDGGLQNVQ